MKKIVLCLIVCVLFSCLVLAKGPQGIHEPGTGIENPEVEEASQGQGIELPAVEETQRQNEGEESQIQDQIQVQNRIQSGEYMTEGGKQLQVQEQSNNRLQLNSGGVSAQTALGLVQEQEQDRTRLKVGLSNGKNSEINVMPGTASERAMERLRLKVCSEENNCQIELKEVGQGEQVKAAYEVRAQKQSKVLGLFRARMQVQAQVDAETGEMLQVRKPWWAFLASESEE